ncbi:hypothetical protein [Alkalihalobacterium elongatum]|uniref:hypothetical protein n=1 Tax=Alkalihalobacterium elongatum TaxID=2675466 RepID=UPI001C1F7DDF|nr:hypothetical protein [Alkalihalobacterium elongatum]
MDKENINKEMSYKQKKQTEKMELSSTGFGFVPEGANIEANAEKSSEKDNSSY